VNECRKEQPFQIEVPKPKASRFDEESVEHVHLYSSPASPTEENKEIEMALQYPSTSIASEFAGEPTPTITTSPITGITIYHQRSALLKSMLNFFKKSIADSSNNNVPNLGDSIRHMMEFSLPNSLKHIISNSDYYGPSLFVLATDVVQLFIFQEPSQLSQLQDNGLTDVILFALLKKNVPATREVLSSLPTVFSALCLNTRGLNAFIESKPFDKLFQVLLSPDYLQAMKRRRNTDQLNTGVNVAGANSTISGTASQLGSAMDELMRHQPSLRIESINSIIKLLYQLIEMGKNPSYVCQRTNSSTASSKTNLRGLDGASTVQRDSNARRATRIIDGQTGQAQNSQNQQSNAASVSGAVANAQQSSDDEDEDYENTMMVDSDCATNASSSNMPLGRAAGQTATISRQVQQNQTTQSDQQPKPVECVPLLDYITNIMKFIEAILSNNSTDDHCKEFVKQKGLHPLLQILSLPNLPIDFPNSQSCQSVSLVCKAILNLAREQQVIDQALFSLQDVLKNCEVFFTSNKQKFDGSVLIHELALAENPLDAINCPSQTPLLHTISSVHSYIYLLITLGKTSQNDVRNLTINKWGSDLGISVLRMLCKLYMSLIWESSMLLWLSNEEQQQQQTTSSATGGQQPQDFPNQMQNFEFNKNDLERLKAFLNSATASTQQAGPSSDGINDMKMDESGRPFFFSL
jgi:E3 ubiquitin-protein ligase HUWE1